MRVFAPTGAGSAAETETVPAPVGRLLAGERP